MKNNISEKSAQLDLQNYTSIWTNDPCLGNFCIFVFFGIFLSKKTVKRNYNLILGGGGGEGRGRGVIECQEGVSGLSKN